jgi:hypothetical protein
VNDISLQPGDVFYDLGCTILSYRTCELIKSQAAMVDGWQNLQNDSLAFGALVWKKMWSS